MKFRRYNCSTVRDMLPLHVGGDLDPRHVGEVDEHLHACLTCFREFRELATMRGRLGVLAEEPLPEGILDGFAEEVMARIAVGEPGPAAAPPKAPLLRLPSVRLAAAAALMLAASLAITLSLTKDDSGTTNLRSQNSSLVDRGPRKEHGWPAPSLTAVGGRPQSGMRPASTGSDSALFGLPTALEIRSDTELRAVLDFLSRRDGSGGERQVYNLGAGGVTMTGASSSMTLPRLPWVDDR